MAAGKFAEGIERWYADEVVMQEAGGPERVGKAVNLARERAFLGSLASISARLVRSALSGATGFSEWDYAIERAGRPPYRFRQIAVREWRAGRIARETFYHPDFPSELTGTPVSAISGVAA